MCFYIKLNFVVGVDNYLWVFYVHEWLVGKSSMMQNCSLYPWPVYTESH